MDNPTSESSNEPLDSNGAADAFSSLLGDDGPAENESQQENDASPEAAAERLAKQELTGEQDQPDEGEGDPDPEADDVTVVIDGKTVKLTKAQIAENYRADMRDKDYRQKTMAAAEVRKTADAEIAQARQERQQYAQQLQNYAIRMQGDLQDQSQIDWRQLAQDDPAEYVIQKSIFDERQVNLAQAQQELQKVNQIQQQEHAESQRTYLQNQTQIMADTLPEWKDPVKRQAAIAALEPFLESRGFTQNDGTLVLDARILLMANEVMKYHALMDRAGKAVKKVAALPVKVERSGSPESAKPDGRTESMKRLGKSGSINDAASVFSQFL